MPVAAMRLFSSRTMSLLAVAIVMAGAPLAVDAANAQEPAPVEDDPTDDELPLEVSLVEQSTWVEPGSDFAMTLAVAGEGGIPDDAALTARVYGRLINRHRFSETLLGIFPQQLSTPLASVPIGEIERTADGHFVVAFNVALAGLSEEGVYPLGVTITAADGQPLGEMSTHLLLQPQAEFAPLDVAVVVEMGAGPAQQPDGSIDLPRDELTRLAERAELLAETNARLSVAPVPETLNSLVLSDEPQADVLLDDLLPALPNHQVLARPYVDVDLEAWVAADLVPHVTAEADRGAAVLRERFDIEPEPSIWLSGATVGQAEATTWRDLGIVQAILPEDAVEVPGVPDSIWPPIELPDGPPGFISDSILTDRLMAVSEPAEQHRFIAELAMIWFEQPGAGRAVVLRLPPDGALDAQAVAATLNSLGPSLSLVTATELLADHGPTEQQPAAPVSLLPKESSDDLSWMQPQLVQAELTLESLSDILDGDELASLERSLLIAPGAHTEQPQAYIDRVDDAASGIVGAIRAPEEFRITLTDRDGIIPLTITNDLDEEVAVRVALESNQLEFRDSEVFEVDVPPGSTRFDVRVRTRTSGAFPLHVTLTSPDGTIVFDETTFDIRSTVISGVGLFISVGAGLFLVVWWLRHWLRTRRARHAPVTEAVPAPTSQ